MENSIKKQVLAFATGAICTYVSVTGSQFINANTADPGTIDDPAVAESYLKKYVSDNTVTIKKYVDDSINKLREELKNNNSGTTGGTNNGTTGGTTGGETTTKTNAVIVDYSVNLRTEANYSSTVLATIKVGEKVQWLSDTGVFSKITYKGKTGYVVAKYVKKDTSNQIQTPAPTPPAVVKGTVTANTALNIRSGAGSNYSVLASAPKGSVVTILQETTGWYKVQYGNITGWASSSYIKKV